MNQFKPWPTTPPIKRSVRILSLKSYAEVELWLIDKIGTVRKCALESYTGGGPIKEFVFNVESDNNIDPQIMYFVERNKMLEEKFRSENNFPT